MASVCNTLLPLPSLFSLFDSIGDVQFNAKCFLRLNAYYRLGVVCRAFTHLRIACVCIHRASFTYHRRVCTLIHTSIHTYENKLSAYTQSSMYTTQAACAHIHIVPFRVQEQCTHSVHSLYIDFHLHNPKESVQVYTEFYLKSENILYYRYIHRF
jgi:hypothetical protein